MASEPSTVRLRPLTPEDVAALEAATGAEADPFNWAGHVDSGRLAAEIAARQTLRDDGGRLAVVDGQGTLLGDVSWRQIRTGPSSHSWCWNIGGAALARHGPLCRAAQRVVTGL